MVVCRLTEIMTILAVINDKAAIDGKILLTRCRERVCRGQEDRLPPAGQAPRRSLNVRAILNIGLRHPLFHIVVTKSCQL